MKKLLLAFDIDGTLLNANGAGRHALQLAMSAHFGDEQGMEKVPFAGRTDRAIMRDILANRGLSSDQINDHLHVVAGLYVKIFREHEAHYNILPLPGVVVLLEKLCANPMVTLTLLTGNLEESAFVKLGKASLAHFFKIGSYGSDSEERDHLPRILLNRIPNNNGAVADPKRLVIIGDTPLDIKCARHAGSVAIAVATGIFSSDQLRPHSPDLLLEDLSDPQPFLNFLKTLSSL